MKSTKLSLFSAKSALLSLLVLFSVTVVFVSCQQTTDTETEYVYDDVLFQTKWADSYTTYNPYETYDVQVSAKFVETSSYGKQTGTVVQVKLSETSGYIYYQITDTSSFTYSDKEASSYLNKWYGIYYTDLSVNSVKMCDAYPAFETADPTTYKVPDYHCAETLEDAIKNITVENKYFENTIDFVRVKQNKSVFNYGG